MVGHSEERRLERAQRFVEAAAELGEKPASLAIAWCLRNPHVSSVILGASTTAQLLENLGAIDLELSEEHVERLSAATQFDEGFPRSFLESDHVRGLIFGGTFDLIDDPRAPRPRERVGAA